MTGEAMSPLRRRMIEDMTIRKFAPKTRPDYVQRVKNFAAPAETLIDNFAQMPLSSAAKDKGLTVASHFRCPARARRRTASPCQFLITSKAAAFNECSIFQASVAFSHAIACL
jgi:hypothetical protein